MATMMMAMILRNLFPSENDLKSEAHAKLLSESARNEYELQKKADQEFLKVTELLRLSAIISGDIAKFLKYLSYEQESDKGQSLIKFYEYDFHANCSNVTNIKNSKSLSRGGLRCLKTGPKLLPVRDAMRRELEWISETLDKPVLRLSRKRYQLGYYKIAIKPILYIIRQKFNTLIMYICTKDAEFPFHKAKKWNSLMKSVNKFDKVYSMMP